MTAAPIPMNRPRRTPPAEPPAVEDAADSELLAMALGGDRQAARRARLLLDQCGDAAGVARASVAQLETVGLPPGVATRLVAALRFARRATAPPAPAAWTVRSPADIAEPLLDAMGPLEREELRVLLLDTKNVVTAMRTVYIGNLAGSPVRVGEVFIDAVRACAASLVVIHNHPSGDPTPSADDLRITVELGDAGRLLDIELLDHLVIGRGRWVSLRALGALGQNATMR